jgi:hypothetical protein
MLGLFSGIGGEEAMVGKAPECHESANTLGIRSREDPKPDLHPPKRYQIA